MSKVRPKKQWRKYERKLDTIESVELLAVSMDEEKALSVGGNKGATFVSLEDEASPAASEKLESFGEPGPGGQDDFISVVSSQLLAL